MIIEIKDLEPSMTEEVVQMWRDSKRRALGDYLEPHTFDHFKTFLTEILAKTHLVKIAVEPTSGTIVGFLAVSEGSLSQLYVHTEYQHRGIGALLLQLAKKLSPSGLKAYTFQSNQPAQKFYEKHGFRAVAFNFPNEENLPDILYEWP